MLNNMKTTTTNLSKIDRERETERENAHNYASNCLVQSVIPWRNDRTGHSLFVAAVKEN